MVSHQVRLNIESGDLDTGFAVSLQCFDTNQQLVLMQRGRLPAQPSLRHRYHLWKETYLKWGGTFRLDPLSTEPANISWIEQVNEAAQTLKLELNQWLESQDFRSLRQKLCQQLSATQSRVLIIQTCNLTIQKLPWFGWHVLEAFPLTQLLLAPASYRTIVPSSPSTPDQGVKLLAVLPAGTAVDTQGDRVILETLPNTQLKILEPSTRRELTDQLWSGPWDIFFFAGHSSSQTGQGQFTISQDQWLTPSEIKFGLQTAASQGLQLAIFNSCDGLAIAQDLVQHDIPFIITMREPVPDDVAQTFLHYFLTAYNSGKSLFQSFQEARKRLEAIEDRCPCATWLPVMMCNPTAAPPSWKELYQRTNHNDVAPEQRVHRKPKHSYPFNRLLLLSVLLGLLVIRSFGFLQELELWAFDQLMQIRPQEIQDSRLLIVEIDEATLQRQQPTQGSISDQALHQAIQMLNQYQPRVIGIDIYRDHPDLASSLQNDFQTQPQIIGVCKSPDPGHDDQGVAAPKGLPNERVGFSDILEDSDGVVRRQLLFMDLAAIDTCMTPWSFSAQLALHYLEVENMHPHFSTPPLNRSQHLILGKQPIYPIQKFWGGYQRINLGGNQVMLNYRALPKLGDIATRVSLSDVLQDQVSRSLIQDRLVMIGVSANTTADFWETPYHSTQNHRIPGVFLQAHMASQLISAVKDNRPLIHVLPQWGEMVLILLWGLVSLFLSQRFGPWQGMILLSGLSLVAMSWVGLIYGLWLPLVPCLLAVTILGCWHKPHQT